MNKQCENICKLNQTELKEYVTFKLLATHDDIHSFDGYVFAKGTFPVLLIAHLDTVHETVPTEFIYSSDGNEVSSPQGVGGDDRCGVYMIFEILKKVNCSVLFLEDEECGLVGAKKFIKTELAKTLSFNYIIELDRKGYNDAVFYNLNNPKFEKFITKRYFEKAYGTRSDISEIAPFLNVAAVNLSCGYYYAHTKNEMVDLTEVETIISEVVNLLLSTKETDIFKYYESN